MSSYKKGRRFEYRVRDFLKKRGWYVVRSAKSGTITDLIALKRGRILLIQCKVNKYLTKDEKREFLEAEKISGGKAVIAYRDGKKLKFMDLEGNEIDKSFFGDENE